MKTPVLIAVKFRRASAPYNAGELAGFEADHAIKLVDLGIAEYIEAPPGLDVFGAKLKAPDTPVKKKKTAAKKKASAKPKGAAKPKAKAKAKA